MAAGMRFTIFQAITGDSTSTVSGYAGTAALPVCGRPWKSLPWLPIVAGAQVCCIKWWILVPSTEITRRMRVQSKAMVSVVWAFIYLTT